jgi:hypothetical protein
MHREFDHHFARRREKVSRSVMKSDRGCVVAPGKGILMWVSNDWLTKSASVRCTHED